MHCNHCGNLIPDDSAFCPDCGGRVEREPADESVISAETDPSESERYLINNQAGEPSVCFCFIQESFSIKALSFLSRLHQ